MKILDITPYYGYFVETDEGQYRCNKDGTVWERLYGESWESEYSDEARLTKLFAARMG